MGLFGRNKHDIVPSVKDLNFVVTKFKKVDEIKINAKTVVPDGHTLIIGKKGKVCDKFDSGEHYFNFASLPVMCRKFHIDDSKKNGNKKEFPADFYFVKNDIRCGTFETYRKVEMGTKAYGLFSAKFYGEYYYKVSDSKEFMQSLLNEYDFIKTGEAEKLLSTWVNDEVVGILENQNFLLTDVLKNNPIIAETLKNSLSKLFSVAGLELLEVKITKYKLPKKYERQVVVSQLEELPKNNQNGKAEEDIEVKEEGIYANEDCGQKEEKKDEEIPKADVKKQEYYQTESIDEDLNDAKNLLKEFGIEKEDKHNIINKEEKQEVLERSTNKKEEIEINVQEKLDETIHEVFLEETIKENKTQDKAGYVSNNEEANAISKESEAYVPFGSFVIENSMSEKNLAKQKKEKTFVDLSLNELYTNEGNTKRCLNCGTQNDKNANHCLICGEKFNKGDIYENN